MVFLFSYHPHSVLGTQMRTEQYLNQDRNRQRHLTALMDREPMGQDNVLVLF
jgi:hypothetical protein